MRAADFAPGMLVRATVDDTAGQRVTTDIRVERVDRLGCGCRRMRCVRPGPREQAPTSTDLELLTGCAYHPGDVATPAQAGAR